MRYFEGLAGAENYAQNSSKKHNGTRYVTKTTVINIGVSYFVYEEWEELDAGEKLISTFKNGERQ